MKQVKKLLSITLAFLIVLPVITFSAVPVYVSLAKDPVAFEAMSFLGAADTPIVVEETEIDDDKAGPTVTALYVASVPNKTKYYYGERIDFTGLEVLALYSDGSEKTITATQNFGLLTVSSTVANATSPDMLFAPQIIELSIDDETTSFIIDVFKEVSSLKLDAPPQKLSYCYGQKIDLEGIMITVTFTDNSTMLITGSLNDWLLTFNNEYANKTEPNKDSAVQTVALSFGGKTVSFDITVNNAVQSISIDPGSTHKTVYKYGESLDISNLKLLVERLDGNHIITAPCEGVECDISTAKYEAEYDLFGKLLYTPFDFVTVTVKYGGKQTTFEITVNNEVDNIEIVRLPDKLTYNYNDLVNLSGIQVDATYIDGYYEEDVGIDDFEPQLATEIGVQEITIVRYEKNAKFNITVLNPVTGLDLLRGPYKTLYKTGQGFSPEGIELRAHYKDGTEEFMTSGYSVNFNSANPAIGKVVTLTYSYDGASKSVTFTVDIFAPSALSTGGAYEMNYKENVEFDPSIPERSYQSDVTYGYWISDTSVAEIDADRIYGLRRGTVKLRVTAVEVIEKDGQTLTFEYSERTTIRVKLTFWQWFIKYFVLFGWLGFDIYI